MRVVSNLHKFATDFSHFASAVASPSSISPGCTADQHQSHIQKVALSNRGGQEEPSYSKTCTMYRAKAKQRRARRRLGTYIIKRLDVRSLSASGGGADLVLRRALPEKSLNEPKTVSAMPGVEAQDGSGLCFPILFIFGGATQERCCLGADR